ncbi:hypothetical protein QR680_017963 [Steinernema hermaphroditum]|uniref:Carbonic anhydrase n=1 Tax=Steinernema hermaphroditum TaxID=289476 RepID=A0AA39HIT6_9BILA|nr:hypothetical protein QR680_017963 [Steinernema hermaphroditum]
MQARRLSLGCTCPLPRLRHRSQPRSLIITAAIARSNAQWLLLPPANMDKILRGVISYRQVIRKDLIKQFEQIRDHPNPTAVMFTCMDSRMLPSRFTQSKVGDIFIVRNAGNMIPDSPNYGIPGVEVSVTTEPAALELAVKRGGIRHVIVCGHSDCKAINTLYGLHQCPKVFDHESPMDHWVRRNGYKSIKLLHERLHHGPQVLRFESTVVPSQSFDAIIDPFDKLAVEDKLSQINVLQQVMNVCSHGFLKSYFTAGQMNIHALWFDVYTGNVFIFSRERKRYVEITEDSVPDLLRELDRRSKYMLEHSKEAERQQESEEVAEEKQKQEVSQS